MLFYLLTTCLLLLLRYKLFQYIDHNGSGRISWYEIKAYPYSPPHP